MKFLPIFLALAVATSAHAADATKTEITSRALEMTSNDDESRAVFTGDVQVTGTNLSLTCDRLEVVATRIGDKSATLGKLERFKSLVATGRVRIVQADREATCGRAEVYPREDKIILTQNPTVIDHGSGSVAVGEPLILFRGERRVQGENIRITFPPIRDLGFEADKKAPEGQ
ncbi:MAG: LptA/OstA family protein [Opitutaceae bacterium]|nr:LptA/OstA family protein [Opitutaceae bacterium]